MIKTDREIITHWAEATDGSSLTLLVRAAKRAALEAAAEQCDEVIDRHTAGVAAVVAQELGDKIRALMPKSDKDTDT